MTPQIWIVALTLYGEAGNQGAHGIDLIAQVISNRAERKGKTYSEVCLERKQFSYWNKNKDLNSTIEAFVNTPDYQTKSFLYCVEKAKNMPLADIRGTYYYYHTIKAHPSWSKKAISSRSFYQYGNHRFFTKAIIDGGN